ncbi:immunoglobulin lambda-1 light chain-like [Mustela lutreola]|uniref:immunoglobulin lambda-1 light chain-like n=1 Tax=Mustela lutreola TaxID=9666 RepID=UPI0027976F6A|nr:immunoglobulin lambda-1 light chain-like [Mustela lutreola]
MGDRTMLGPLALLCALLFPDGGAGLKLSQTALLVARVGSSTPLDCKVDAWVKYIHWYRHQEGTAPKRLLYLDMSTSLVQRDFVLKADKVNANKGRDSYSCTLSLLKLEKSDEGVYYCAAWEGWIKIFIEGTKLTKTSPDKSPDEDIFPKPTVFLPSVAEVEVHKAGTYLCLLEDFFPDVIKVHWQEKDDKTILKSQQGDTMKTKDTYMKFSWLTVTGASMDKEHRCIVNHQRNNREVIQEILFPSISKGLMAVTESEMDSQGHSETKENTEVVTVSPLNSGYFSPDPMAVELAAINSTKFSLNDENGEFNRCLSDLTSKLCLSCLGDGGGGDGDTPCSCNLETHLPTIPTSSSS